MCQNCQTLIRAGVLVTQDQERRIVEDAGLALDQGLVLAAGPWDQVRTAYGPKETLDLSGHMVLPGLINTHTHAAMTVLRGLEDDLPLMDWLQNHVWPAEARLSPEIVYLGACLACAEMLSTGTTCFLDLYLFEEHTARAVMASGMRAVLGEGVLAQATASYKSLDQALAKVEALRRLCKDHPRLKTCLVGHSVYATTHEALARLRDLAESHDEVMTLHAGESAAETAMCLERFARRPVAVLADLGLLRPNLLVAHAVDLTVQEIELLAVAGVKVAHNPRSNMKLASGTARISAMRRAGITVGLGTDGAASNNSLNLFAEMSAAALLAKVHTQDPTTLPAQEVLDMATVSGAACVGWEDLGSLSPGRAADLIALDMTRPNLQPRHNPVSHLVYAASGHEVRLSMVAGRVVYRDGQFTDLDYPALLRELAGVVRWARQNT